MTGGLSYATEAAEGYEKAFAHVSSYFIPFLLRSARLKPGMRVLDIATGTGLAAEAALALVGATGHVTAADISSAMAEKARARLDSALNATVAIEDGQSLSFPDESFDGVVCSLGLMFFPDPARGLAEFRRVLRPGGRAAVTVTTTMERSYNGRINRAIARYKPALEPAHARFFSLGDEVRLRTLFETAGFSDIEIASEMHRFTLPSFAAYFEPFERGGGSSGQAYVALTEDQRRAIRDELRHEHGDTGGPIEIEVELRIASGQQ